VVLVSHAVGRQSTGQGPALVVAAVVEPLNKMGHKDDKDLTGHCARHECGEPTRRALRFGNFTLEARMDRYETRLHLLDIR
jgi:hypothetical protein